MSYVNPGASGIGDLSKDIALLLLCLMSPVWHAWTLWALYRALSLPRTKCLVSSTKAAT